MKQSQILVIGPSRKTRGGITAVLKAYESHSKWKDWDCIWIETHIDRSALRKICFFLTALALYLPRLPFARLVHIHMSEHIGTLRKSFFAIPAILIGKPVVLHFHSCSRAKTIEGPFRGLYKFLFHRAQKVIVLSSQWGAEIDQAFGGIPWALLPNPCPNPDSSVESYHDARPYILFAATLYEAKGYKDLIRAFAQVADRHPDWDLVLAGNGEMETARQIADECKIGTRTTLPGWVAGVDKDRLFKNAAILCLPSYNEGFPMAVLDAFSFSIPVITTPVGGIPDFLTDGENASLTPVGDISELSRRLDELMCSPEKRAALAQASLTLSQTTFALPSILNELDILYKQIAPP